VAPQRLVRPGFTHGIGCALPTDRQAEPWEGSRGIVVAPLFLPIPVAAHGSERQLVRTTL
jgi:hypothetical protein